MPDIIRVEEIAKFAGQEVRVQGWVYNPIYSQHYYYPISKK